MILPVIYSDSHFFAINKPFGLTVNRSETTGEAETLFDIIDQQGLVKSFPEALEFNDRHGVVHRLDKETSGVMLIAKTPEAFVALQKQFKGREVQKEYLALVHGTFEDSEKSFTVDAPIGRNPRNRFRNAVVASGRPAVTEFKIGDQVVKLSGRQVINSVENMKTWQPENLTLLRAFPHTGRTHQIRVHLAALDHPVCGDSIYSPKNLYKEYVSFLESKRIPVRMFLHAAKITFSHPVTGIKMTLEAPLPSELSEVLSTMQLS